MWRIGFYESILSYRWLKPANSEEQSEWKSTGFHEDATEIIYSCSMCLYVHERGMMMMVYQNDILNFEITKHNDLHTEYICMSVYFPSFSNLKPRRIYFLSLKIKRTKSKFRQNQVSAILYGVPSVYSFVHSS